MLDSWDIILTQILNSIGSVASISAYQAMLDEQNRIPIEDKKPIKPVKSKATLKPKSPIRRFLYRFKYLLIIIAIVAVLSFAIQIIKSRTEKSITPQTPQDTPLQAETNTPITSWPIKRSAKDRWLDEMEPKVSDYNAFFVSMWDGFDEVTVKDYVYPHSIGVKIPLKDQKKYRATIGGGLIEHKEYIQYSLGFEYETLQFDFGIDGLSFPDGVAEHSKCLFKIIVDVCDSGTFYSSKQKHLFETDWLNDQCCLHRTPEMDVSGYESVRITFMWQFSPNENGPSAFNLAIANPILRAEKLRK